MDKESVVDVVGEYYSKVWGGYKVLDMGQGFKIKRLYVVPGFKLSYQRHAHRAEHWVVVFGTGVVVVNGNLHFLTEDSYIHIPKLSWHSVQNIGKSSLIISETMCGNYIEEDDIQRKDMSAFVGSKICDSHLNSMQCVVLDNLPDREGNK